MDNILDDVSLKWFNASEGEKIGLKTHHNYVYGHAWEMNRVLGQGQRSNFTWDEPNTNEWEPQILCDLAFSLVTCKLRRLNLASEQALQLWRAKRDKG